MINKYTKTKSYQSIYRINRPSRVSKMLVVFLVIIILCLFLPWTQNIRSKGKVSTLRQEQRAQVVNTIIGGRILKWYVQEGQWVQPGDTLVQLAEIKDDYLDPKLLERTGQQLAAKQQSIEFYKAKNEAAQKQIAALESGLNIKLQQLQNKITQQQNKIRSDSATLVAANNDVQIAEKQYKRQKELYDQGLVSLAQLEQRNITLLGTQARVETARNNLINSKQELDITRLEVLSVQQEVLDKVNKAQGEAMSALSQAATTEAETAKLSNQLSNYRIRNGMYFVLAPQEGQIIQARRSGIGEIIKEGEPLVQIVPRQQDLAVEIFVPALDVPLLNIGQRIRFIFDGFPAIVFSGWPAASYGTFGGIVSAIENNSQTGMYRVLVKEDKNDKPWPKALRLGTGAQAIALLKDVPIWYEIWRNINGFPPDYYTLPKSDKDGTNDKKS